MQDDDDDDDGSRAVVFDFFVFYFPTEEAKGPVRQYYSSYNTS